MVSCGEDFERIKELAFEQPTFVSKEHIENELIPGTIQATVLIAALFIVYSTAGRCFAPKREAQVIYNTAYQITNMTVNAILGAMGAYFYFHVLDHMKPSVDNLVLGYRSIYPLACLQLGKNLWALPLAATGIVHEPPAKMAHHIAVVLVVLASSVFSTGFNYFGPFLFGILELSSVPLAVVLLFKENPDLIKRHPKEYTMVRMLFAASFLYIRWYIYLPLKWVMLRLVAFRVYASYESGQYLLFSAGCLAWVAAFFIAVLQVYWGILIIQSVLKFASKPSSPSIKA